jgi:prevent-host-death family protein
MREFTSQDLQKKTSVVQEAALVEPITITFRGRPRHVMTSMREFERLRQRGDPKVYRLSEIPDDRSTALSEAEMAPKHDDPAVESGEDEPPEGP